MLVGNQSDVVTFLKDCLTSQGTEVELISTHASLIFLAGDRAFKLKRAVQYPYLDFSTRKNGSPRARLKSSSTGAPRPICTLACGLSRTRLTAA